MAPKKATLLPRMSKRGPFSVEVSGVTKVEGETIPRRHPNAKDGLYTVPDPAVTTAYDIVNYSAKKYGNAQCIGTRTVVDTHTEKKMVKKMVDGKETEIEKDWTYFELSPYKFISFIEFQKHVRVLGSAMKKLGLAKGDKIHIYGATSMNWISMAHGAFTQSITIATAYDTLGLEGLKASLKQSKSRAIFVDAGLLPMLNKALKEITTIEFVILNNETAPGPEEVDKLKTEYSNVKVMGFEDIKALGLENPAEQVPPAPEDLACVMFTSGTSGAPKGVTIKHKAIVAAIAGAHGVVGEHIGPGDGLLAYLPLAHIIEFIFENAAIFWGTRMGYGSPKTLTDTSVRKCKGDIAEFRPSIMVGVPAVWELIKKGIQTKVNAGSPITRNLFWGALAAKKALLSAKLPGVKLIDAVVFSKVRAATGGNLRFCMSGGGPIAKETQRFISLAICPVINGYGLTETCGMGALNDPLAWTVEAHGDIPPAVEVKLVDFADAGYYTTSDPPQGEIWIRGAPVTEGYYDNDEETRNAIRDGWFMTGDIAEFDRNGHVKVIDRKKNLVKTLNGEYIALEKLETIYRSSPLVANVCVYAAEDQTKPVAVIVPAEPALVKLANSNGIQGHSVEDLADNEKLNRLVLKELQITGRQGQLTGIEIIDGVVIDDDEWTPQNGYVTATQKILRKKIAAKHQEGLKRAYGGN